MSTKQNFVSFNNYYISTNCLPFNLSSNGLVWCWMFLGVVHLGFEISVLLPLFTAGTSVLVTIPSNYFSSWLSFSVPCPLFPTMSSVFFNFSYNDLGSCWTFLGLVRVGIEIPVPLPLFAAGNFWTFIHDDLSHTCNSKNNQLAL